MDTTAQNQPIPSPVVPTPPQDSYADAYVPPAQPVAASPAPVNTADSSAESVQPPPPPTGYNQPTEPTQPAELIQPTQPTEQTQPTEPTESTQPTEPTAPPEPTSPSEALADQNIFEMLGVTTGTPEQREQFLDELQQVIWDDFIENDTKLLLTESEQTELRNLLQQSEGNQLEQQEKAVVFLEKLIPDLEEIMLEKAMQLKEEMVRERLRALRELNRNDQDKLAAVEKAEQLMAQQQWRSAAAALNNLG